MPVYPEIPVGFGFIRHTWSTPGGDTHAVCVHGIQNVGAESSLSAATAINAFMGARWSTVGTEDYALTSTYCFMQDGVGGNEYTFLSAIPGTSLTPSVTPNTAVVWRKASLLLGRRGRGYMYVPGIASAALQSDRTSLTVGALTNWEVAAGGYYTDLAAEFSMVLLHRPSLKAGAPPPPPPTAVISLTPEPKISSQSRRLRPSPHA